MKMKPAENSRGAPVSRDAALILSPALTARPGNVIFDA